MVHAAYSCEPILAFSENQTLSDEGAQQGDPLEPLEFCETVHPFITGLESDVKIGFMDDLSLSGDLHTVEKDVFAIMDSAAEAGLNLNQAKCEIIMDDFSLISTLPIFNQFIRVEKENITLLGAPVVRGRAQDAAIQQKIEELDRAMKRLSLLHAHDSLALLKNSLAMPKLLFLLRTADYSGNQLLEVFDITLRAGLSKVLNVDLNDDQWLQASLPVGEGGLGIRSAQMVAPSAFLASAASTSALHSPQQCQPAGRPVRHIH